jgi:hypothetical protein
MTPPLNSFIVGSSNSGFILKTLQETQSLLGIIPGVNIQQFSTLLQSISDSSNSTLSGAKYFYVLNGGAIPSLQRRIASDARLDMGFSTLGSSLVTASSPTSAQSLIQVIPGIHVQPINTSLSEISSNTWAGSSSINTVGSISQGFWNATPVIPLKGGTGLSQSPTSNQLLVGTSNGGYQLTRSLNLQSLSLDSGNSTVSPLSINSTTKVNNLNADTIDGIDFSEGITANKTFVDKDYVRHNISIKNGLIIQWGETPEPTPTPNQ